MSYANEKMPHQVADTVPGEEDRLDKEVAAGVRGYLIALGLSVLLTAISFSLPSTTLVWAPAIPIALVVFAIAQMGVHLVFFLHITSGPDNTNNVLALAFGVLIVLLIMVGTLWIMANLNANMAPAAELMNLQMQH